MVMRPCPLLLGSRHRGVSCILPMPSRWQRYPELILPPVTTVLGKTRPLSLSGCHTEAEAGHQVLATVTPTSALSPQICSSGVCVAASHEGCGHLASLCTVHCEGGRGERHVSSAGFGMHLSKVSVLGPQPGAKGAFQAWERRVKGWLQTQACLPREAELCQCWVEGLECCV